VWEVFSSDISGGIDRLEAFDAIPGSGTLKEIWSGPVGSTHFAVPATDGGRVYVGSRDDGGADRTEGVVYCFGVPAP
jgi:hypothetical protein